MEFLSPYPPLTHIHGDPHGVGMGIEIPSPRQAAALDSAVSMGIPMGIPILTADLPITQLLPKLLDPNFCTDCVQCQSKILPPKNFWQYFPSDGKYLHEILPAHCTFMYTQNYKTVFNYLSH